MVLAGLAMLVATPTDEFAYSYPAQVSAIPALKARLDGEAARLRAKFRRDTAADARAAKAEARPYHPWELKTKWEVVTDTPGFLSLSAAISSYSGGAHGNLGYDALLWDKRRGRGMASLAVFASRAAFNAALRKPFCAALNREREQRRGEPVRPGGSGFNDCIDPTAQTVILGSTDRRRFDRIGVLMGPYAAGSYAEGPYEVTLPVTAAVLAAVRPEYRAAFAVR